MKIIKILTLGVLWIGSAITGAYAQSKPTAISQADNDQTMAMITNAFGSMTLKNITPTTQDLQIKFPPTTAQTQPNTSILPKGSSWSQLPIGAFTGVGSVQNESMLTLAQKIYTNSSDVQTAVQGALTNFKFLDKVPVKQLVAAFPQLANVAIEAEQVGSWGGCGAGMAPTFGNIAASACGSNPIPADVRAAVPISQTGLQSISYGSLASKLEIQGLPANSFPLAADVSFDKILLPPSANFTSANLMRVDHLEIQIPGQSGQKIRGINSISGSNRVRNSTCKEAKCDYTVLQNIVPGSSNPLNRNLAIQVHQPGKTAWIDGGIGSIGRTLWNLKEPPGVAPAFDTDHFKLVLEQANPKAGTVEQKLYLAFCTNVGTEWNCSSKFIGPITLPMPQVSEQNKLTLLPMQVDMPNVAIPTSAVPAVPTLPTIIPTKQSNEIAPNASISKVSAISGKTETSIAYRKLFGSNTLASYSPLSNISNLI
jgi:hypothetical protein